MKGLKALEIIRVSGGDYPACGYKKLSKLSGLNDCEVLISESQVTAVNASDGGIGCNGQLYLLCTPGLNENMGVINQGDSGSCNKRYLHLYCNIPQGCCGYMVYPN